MAKQGISGAEVARALKTNPTTISGWKAGKSPDAEALSKLPGILKCSGHWLLTGEPPIEPPKERPDLQTAYDDGWSAAMDQIRQRAAEAAPRVGTSEPLSDEEVRKRQKRAKVKAGAAKAGKARRTGRG